MQHGGQTLLEDDCVGSTARPVCTVAQSDRSVFAGATPAVSTLLSANSALGTPSRTDDSPGIRTQRLAVRHAVSPSFAWHRRWHSRIRTQRAGGTARGQPELRWASAMALPRCAVSRYATAWEESLEGAVSGHQSWALLCRYRCRTLLAEIPKGVDRNYEMKHRLQLWESGQLSVLIGKDLGQQNSGPLRSAAADRRTAREASLCLDSPRHSPHPTEPRHRNSSQQCGVRRHGANRLAWRALQTGAERDEEAGTEQNRHRFVAPRQIVANECSWSYWRTGRTPGCHCLRRRSWPEEAPVPGP